MLNRRRFLGDAGALMSSLALVPLLAQEGLLAAAPGFRPMIDPARPYAPRPPQRPAMADQLLIIFCPGGISHIDAWDYKPELARHDGEDPPNAPKVTFMGPVGKLAQPLWTFRPRGESGKMLSDLLPNLAGLADDMCFVHSLTAKSSAHTQAEYFLSTGFVFEGYPSLGAWTTYALGTVNQNLPAYVAITDPRGRTDAGTNNWGSGFLPATFQATTFNAATPPGNLTPSTRYSAANDKGARELLATLNDAHFERYPGDTDLAARIASYELAGRMQTSVPLLMDLSQEPDHLHRAYGTDSTDPIKSGYARNCLLARRLLESGVRVVQLFNGAGNNGGQTNWDNHTQLLQRHGARAEVFDQPTAAMLCDMKQRGLLERTLVVCCTEFGRMPFMQANDNGRDHNIDGFTCWLMGAGVKPGFSYGATDELGWKAVENVATLYDLNATILRILGFDHEQMTFYHNGAKRRLTDVHGRVLDGVLS